MATIIESNDNPNRPVLVTQDSASGWAVAIVILVIVIIAGAFWYMRYYRPASYTTAPGATVQVNLPSSGYAPTSGTGNTSGNTSGSAQTAPATTQ